MRVIVYGRRGPSPATRAALEAEGFEVVPGFVRNAAEAQAAIASGVADMVVWPWRHLRHAGPLALAALAVAWLASRRRELAAGIAGAAAAGVVAMALQPPVPHTAVVDPALPVPTVVDAAPSPTPTVPVVANQPAPTAGPTQTSAPTTSAPPSPTALTTSPSMPAPSLMTTPTCRAVADVDLLAVDVRVCVGRPEG